MNLGTLHTAAGPAGIYVYHKPLSVMLVRFKLSLTSSVHWFKAPLISSSSVTLPQQQQYICYISDFAPGGSIDKSVTVSNPAAPVAFLCWLLLAVTCKMPSVLWNCWLGVSKSIQPVKVDWWGVVMIICLKRGADCLHIVQLMRLPSPNSIISCPI